MTSLIYVQVIHIFHKLSEYASIVLQLEPVSLIQLNVSQTILIDDPFWKPVVAHDIFIGTHKDVIEAYLVIYGL